MEIENYTYLTEIDDKIKKKTLVDVKSTYKIITSETQGSLYQG